MDCRPAAPITGNRGNPADPPPPPSGAASLQGVPAAPEVSQGEGEGRWGGGGAERRLSPGSLGAGWCGGQGEGKGPGPEGEAQGADWDRLDGAPGPGLKVSLPPALGLPPAGRPRPQLCGAARVGSQRKDRAAGTQRWAVTENIALQGWRSLGAPLEVGGCGPRTHRCPAPLLSPQPAHRRPHKGTHGCDPILQERARSADCTIPDGRCPGWSRNLGGGAGVPGHWLCLPPLGAQPLSGGSAQEP